MRAKFDLRVDDAVRMQICILRFRKLPQRSYIEKCDAVSASHFSKGRKNENH